MAFLSSYQAVLRTPHACGAFVTSLVGRLSYGIVSLSLILTLTAGGHCRARGGGDRAVPPVDRTAPLASSCRRGDVK